ncbi:hypothetical protein Asp14428_62220 [Actinoplanes sp. NBRC 14428]|nr:hypothetical protein Asp14428_62220 [Actinoplanes sp. NBRC 14428]
MKRMRAAIAVSAMVGASLVAVGAGPNPAAAAGLRSTPVITNNLQGASSGGDNKWTTSVGSFVRQAEIVALQEAGPEPPGESQGNIVWDPNAPGRSGYIQHTRWRPATAQGSYEVYFLQTDSAGGTYVGNRNNLAIVTQREADDLTVIRNPLGGRNMLGVRFGANWYFSIHAFSGGGGDVQAMLQLVSSFVTNRGRNETWTVAGDFNREPDTLILPAQSWIYRTHQPTHIGGSELDYAVSSENIPDHPVRGQPGATPDHQAVAIGALRGGAEPPELRILPFGDSITFGAGSTTSAYRGPLWDELRANQTDTAISYVGSQHYGSVPDNDNEGHPGWTIDQLTGITDSVMDTYKPNLVLLHIGTNDMNENVDAAGAPARLSRLMDRIFARDRDVTLVLSTLVPSTIPATEGRIFEFNKSLPQVVADQRRKDRHVWLVDNWDVMTGCSGDRPECDLADFLHPNDRGFRKMGHVFYEGIRAVEGAGWVQPADPLPGDGSGPVRGWNPQGVVAGGTIAPGAYPGSLTLGRGDEVHFADVNGDTRADYIVTRADQSVEMWFNGGVNSDGTVAWQARRSFSTPRVSLDLRWRFGDINGDGRAEIVKYSIKDFAFTEAYNSDGSRVPLSIYLTDPGAWLADIDGNGWADHLVVRDDSSVTARLNVDGGFGNTKVVASGVGATRDLVRFADLDGDRKADYLVVNADGAINAWMGGGPNSAGGDWYWYYTGTVATGVGVPSSQVHLADIDGDRKADYLAVDPANGNTRMWKGAGPEGNWGWLPKGSITSGSSSHIVYADLNADNRADYLQINADSSVQAWLGGGPKPSGGDWMWQPQGTIAGASVRRAIPYASPTSTPTAAPTTWWSTRTVRCRRG